MIKEGQRKKARYWGNYTVKKVVQLTKPVRCQSSEVGEALFNPTLVKIEWEKSPSDDKHEFWFPYWISIKGQEKYGQFAPMMGERSLLELLTNAIGQGLFTKQFLSELGKCIEKKQAAN
jgi:hypothetical protein